MMYDLLENYLTEALKPLPDEDDPDGDTSISCFMHTD